MLFLFALFCTQKTVAQSPCHVSFYLDTIASTNFNGVLVNTSVFATLPDSMVFGWYWGDGTSGSWGERYPKNHSYTTPGSKTISLVVFTNFNCKDSFARTIFIDTSGAFHKTNATYNVTLVAPHSTGIQKSQTRETVSIIPNIVKDNGTLTFTNNAQVVNVELFSYDGKNVMSVTEKLNGNTMNLETKALHTGMYFALVTSEGNTSVLKFVKQ